MKSQKTKIQSNVVVSRSLWCFNLASEAANPQQYLFAVFSRNVKSPAAGLNTAVKVKVNSFRTEMTSSGSVYVDKINEVYIFT